VKVGDFSKGVLARSTFFRLKKKKKKRMCFELKTCKWKQNALTSDIPMGVHRRRKRLAVLHANLVGGANVEIPFVQ
jgi:hypothetical protein